VFWTIFSHNLLYVFVGRYSGLLPYFFPAVFALVLFALVGRSNPPWRVLVFAAAAGEILLLLIWIPYNYFGGGGVIGNRYFMNTYGLFLFLIPPIESAVAAAVPWIVGPLFTAQIVLNPFFSSFYPAEHAKHGPLRLLPVELTLVNDLPINTSLSRVRVWFGEKHRFQMYFLDDNAYPPEENSFWIRGRSTADMLLKTAEPMRRLLLTFTGADAPDTLTVRAAGERRVIDIQPQEIRQVTIPLDSGFPYQGTRVWTLSITTRTGFVPMFLAKGSDNRYLGVRVKPELLP
jgi:hypothetical protein